MLLRLRRLVKSTGRELAVLWYACRHPDTPLPIKVGAALLAVYFISPIDFIPDTLPILGWVDDVTLITLAIPFLVKLVPASVVNSARASAARTSFKNPFGQRRN